jgi:ribosome-binding ATPase YchF (GTP1/OBG family)
VNAIKDEINELANRLDKARKKIDPKYNRVELVPKGIAEMKKYLETTTAGALKEKELILKMKFLENSKPFILEADELDENQEEGQDRSRPRTR